MELLLFAFIILIKYKMNDISIILKYLFEIMDAIKKQKPKLYELLLRLMRYQGTLYTKDTIIFKVGDEVDRAMFISEGFITCSSKIGKKKLLLNIFEANEIKATPDFMDQKKSEFLIEAIAGTFVAYITYAQMQIVYAKFPEAHELASLIISSHNRKEAKMRQMLLLKGIDLVEAFYLRFPKMTAPGSVLKDAVIASFLKISVSLLREQRAELFATGRLINPIVKKQ